MPKQFMRNPIIGCIPLLLVVAWHSALTKTINAPAMPAEKAIAVARQYVTEKHVNVSNHFLGAVEYINLRNEYERPFWRIEWRLLVGKAMGGQIVVLVYADGTAELRYGE
jgi:stage V sporulation protein SpoVS